MPVSEIREDIGADDEVQQGVGMPVVEFLESVGGVIDAWPLVLQFVDTEGAFSCQSQTQHLGSVVKRRERPVLLVRRPG